MSGMVWRHRAACLEVDPDLFFPLRSTDQQVEEAKAVCHRCPVMETCLQWALESSQECGVWGGLSQDERLVLKPRVPRRRARARADKASRPASAVTGNKGAV